MNRLFQTLYFIAQFIVVGLAAAFVLILFWPGAGNLLHPQPDANTPAPTATISATTGTPARTLPATAASGTGPVSYADAVTQATPSVVNIYANKLVTEQPTLPEPLRSMFGNIPTGPAHTRHEQSLGSGVIISSSGYVLTNNHVIHGARDIQVLLYDGRVAQAKVVGADADTDLAVLKLDAGNLPAIHLAITAPHVGDVVLAIGNPLGIGQTVTMGIISATQRQLSSGNPEQFIQTDAAINFGNSGGALVNAHGLLVGINTALLGHARGAEGIGFAIPVRTAKRVMQQIIDTGHVTRSWLGISYTQVPPQATNGAPTPSHGVIVTGVYPGGPANQADIRPGDILLRMATHDILDPPHLYRRVSTMKPDTKVHFEGTRDGQPFQTELTLAVRPSAPPAAKKTR